MIANKLSTCFCCVTQCSNILVLLLFFRLSWAEKWLLYDSRTCISKAILKPGEAVCNVFRNDRRSKRLLSIHPSVPGVLRHSVKPRTFRSGVDRRSDHVLSQVSLDAASHNFINSSEVLEPYFEGNVGLYVQAQGACITPGASHCRVTGGIVAWELRFYALYHNNHIHIRIHNA
jgi:hypothetical protein